MAKKKIPQIAVTSEENIQVQRIFEQYHQVANDLHASKDQKQVETSLAEINNLSESAQIALLKELSKEIQVDAADVLIAINELSSQKNVRKEARRSLLRLEGVKIYPSWEPPIDRTPAINALQLTTTNPPRFWKGFVSDTYQSGEVQLLLCWEQGEDYKDIRILGFLLEFWYDGVKDFFSSIDSKRGVDNFLAEVNTRMADVEMKNCSLAQGRRLLLKALATNKQHNTSPHKDYRFNLSLIKQLILEAPDIEDDTTDEDSIFDEKSDESINLHGLDPQAVVINFVEHWVNEDFGIAYDLLASNSSLREGLSRDAWIKRRESWAAEAHPSDLEPNFIYERDLQKSKLWLPSSLLTRRPITHKEIETGWSIGLDEIPLSDTLPELPQATAIYEETRRHWFWSSYTLIEENGDWRIQDMTDEGMNALDLPVANLQNKIQELEKLASNVASQHTVAEVKRLKDEDAENYLTEIISYIIQSAYYSDILIKKTPLDRSVYEDALARMGTLGQYERCLAYLLPLAERFPEQRGSWLRQIATIQRLLGQKFAEMGDVEYADRCQELAVQALRDSLSTENSSDAHISLAEFLIEDDELDEAEDHLLQAKELITDDPEEEAHIELHLGEIAMEREEYEKALKHYQRIVELQPDSAESWFNVGEAHQALKHFEEAENSYKHAIELEPDNPGYYYELSRLYKEHDLPSKVIEILQEGLAANPDSVDSHLYMASFYIDRADYHQAEIMLDKAEQIDPDSLDVRSFRFVLNATKSKQTHDSKKLSKPSKHKKKRR